MQITTMLLIQEQSKFWQENGCLLLTSFHSNKTILNRVFG